MRPARVDKGRPRRRVTVRVPSKGAVVVDTDGTRGGARIAMWEQWLDLAERHAAHADECHDPDVTRTASETPEPKVVAGSSEFQHTMLAVVAAANALDGLYGSIRRFVSPPRSSAKRHRQILEALKLGFDVGGSVQGWHNELDWLFDLRNWVVHHDDVYGPLQIVHETPGDIVLMPVDLLRLQAPSAMRAATLARDVVDTCVKRPKPSTSNWVRGWANWEPGPGETVTRADLQARTFIVLPLA